MVEGGEVIDNPSMHRFELPIGDEVATAYYAIEEGRMVFTHTEAPFALSGRGYGSKLARGAFEAARSRGMRVIANVRSWPHTRSSIQSTPPFWTGEAASRMSRPSRRSTQPVEVFTRVSTSRRLGSCP